MMSRLSRRHFIASGLALLYSSGSRGSLAFGKSGTRVSVSGRVAGSAAEGRFEVHYTKTFTSYDVVTHNPKFEIASCSARAPWTARREGSTGEPPR